MKHELRGFTLIEMLIVLAISVVAVASAMPGLNEFYARQELKSYMAQTMNFIQSARQMASTTECLSRVSLRPDGNGTYIRSEVIRSSEWKGCELWFQQSGQGSTNSFLINDARVEHMALQQATTLEFDGVSGSLSPASQKTFIVLSKGLRATFSMEGIGNGVVTYAN
jgi:prepilin-type N-terminal cleavage/methylation domain-containing protein